MTVPMYETAAVLFLKIDRGIRGSAAMYPSKRTNAVRPKTPRMSGTRVRHECQGYETPP